MERRWLLALRMARGDTGRPGAAAGDGHGAGRRSWTPMALAGAVGLILLALGPATAAAVDWTLAIDLLRLLID
jgi:hypothetical protein